MNIYAGIFQTSCFGLRYSNGRYTTTSQVIAGCSTKWTKLQRQATPKAPRVIQMRPLVRVVFPSRVLTNFHPQGESKIEGPSPFIKTRFHGMHQIVHHFQDPVIGDILRIILIAYLEECPGARGERSESHPVSRVCLAMAATVVSSLVCSFVLY
jgi:hypothetical protein